MTYTIIDGSYGVKSSQICTPDNVVWVFNACNRTEWYVQVKLDSTNHHGVSNYIQGRIYKHISPKLTYSLNIYTQTKTVEPIQRMYFDSMENAAAHAQTYITQVVAGGAQ